MKQPKQVKRVIKKKTVYKARYVQAVTLPSTLLTWPSLTSRIERVPELSLCHDRRQGTFINLCHIDVTKEKTVNLQRVVQYTRTESDRLRYAPTRLAGSPMARDLESKRITRVMSLQRVGKVGGSSRSDTDGHDPSLRTPTRLAGSPMARDLENKRITTKSNGLTVVCETKWDETKWKWKSVVCEMGICSLRNGNL